VEERIVVEEKEAITILHRLNVAEKCLAEEREKNAELRAINAAYAKRLEKLDAIEKLEQKYEPSVLSQEIAKIQSEAKPEPEPKESEEFAVKAKRCGKCRKTGHYARTCKN